MVGEKATCSKNSSNLPNPRQHLHAASHHSFYHQTSTMSSNLVESDTRFREYFKKYRASKTVNTIPYSSEMPQKDSSDTPLGNFNSKKVTVVGMGQVGLGCVAAIINQDICGTIAVSTEEKLMMYGMWIGGASSVSHCMFVTGYVQTLIHY